MTVQRRFGEGGIKAPVVQLGDGMFVVDRADLVAIRRAFMAGGRDGALIELRRRYMALTDKTVPTVLDRILAMPIDPVKVAGRHEPRRDRPRR